MTKIDIKNKIEKMINQKKAEKVRCEMEKEKLEAGILRCEIEIAKLVVDIIELAICFDNNSLPKNKNKNNKNKKDDKK